MNIKALPSMGQRLFCCICFVESAVCSTFAERIIRGCFRGCTCLKCTNRVRSTPPEGTNRARSAPTELRWCT